MLDRTRIPDLVAGLPVFDTHEHLAPLAQVRQLPADFVELCKSSYVAADLAAVGMTAADWPAPDRTPAQRWATFSPWVRRVENTAYYRSLLIGCRKLYGIPTRDELDEETSAALAVAMQRAWQRDDVIDWALGQTCGVRRALQDAYWDPLAECTGTAVLAPVLRTNALVFAPFSGTKDHNGNSSRDYARFLNLEIAGFDSYLDLIGRIVALVQQRGAPAIKSALAYDRRLDFADVPKADARRLYDRGAAGQSLSPAETKALQDYLMHAVVDAATDHGLPVQIHTGIRTGSGDLRGTHPLLLVDLIATHPKARFDLFHGAYPYGAELGVMAKAFPNVWLDLCWLPLISPAAAGRCLGEWLDTVPAGKLMWGGDCWRVEAAAGAVELARWTVAAALAAKMREGTGFSEAAARRVAQRILHDNAAELFGPA